MNLRVRSRTMYVPMNMRPIYPKPVPSMALSFPRKSCFIAGLALSAFAAPLRGQDIVFTGSAPSAALVELYSSEGCSSCPPAEAWVNSFKNAPGLWKNVFPVVFHVDYWDNLGWPDRFARPEFTQRQRTYALRLGQDSVYTPEFIVNGLEWRRGWLGGQDIGSPRAAKTGQLSLTLHAGQGTVSAVYQPGSPVASQPLTVNVALLGLDLFTDVTRGENAGSKLEHDFIVLGFNSAPLTPSNGQALQAAWPGPKLSTQDAPSALVAWVSGPDGSILQVAGGPLPVVTRK
jgi:hypothetical protein